jgi:hypothetical protein
MQPPWIDLPSANLLSPSSVRLSSDGASRTARPGRPSSFLRCRGPHLGQLVDCLGHPVLQLILHPGTPYQREVLLNVLRRFIHLLATLRAHNRLGRVEGLHTQSPCYRSGRAFSTNFHGCSSFELLVFLCWPFCRASNRPMLPTKGASKGHRARRELLPPQPACGNCRPSYGQSRLHTKQQMRVSAA